MKLLVEKKFAGLYLFLTNSNYRHYIKLLTFYGNKKRFKTTEVKLGKINLKLPDCRSFIPQYEDIFVEENYQFESYSENPVIIDCGANVGLSSIYFSRLYPTATIYAFEADPEIFKFLQSNLSTNKCSNIEAINKAVWKEDGEISLSTEGADGASVVYNEKSIKIPSIRFSDYLSKFENIDMIKMDIEGAEYDVLMDCKDELAKTQNLFIEYHSHKNDNQKLGDVLKLLEDLGFRYFIKSGMKRKIPLINFEKTSSVGFDLMLNIYAKKLDRNESN
ncbi:MAG: FkbM family methyltransferase [Melioribacteraceae bacterium]|nr:FkbM family methyltransferase [Melioribacteraceae bacterium]MCF8263429.1 FkbM family methyltransferase [Melioribacteraceae bacterium]MCF8430427.1 FkbM family methyltransferase [Melioribacteraceae bacterium]